MSFNPEVLHVWLWLVAVLVLSSVIGWILRRKKPSPVTENLVARTNAWWIMVLVFGLAVSIGHLGATLLFALLSFLALREYLTLTPTAPADHRSLFWAFFVVLPLQYWWVWVKWY